MAWGGGNFQRAKAAMCEVGRERTSMAGIPYVKLAPLSAPGPTGDRQEHLDAIIDFAGAAHRRRLFRTLDKLTVRWAIGDLPVCCRWLLNTQAIFLKKDREPQCKHFDDDEWTRLSWEDASADIGPLDDVPVIAVSSADDSAITSPNVQPIQMGEFLRKHVSERLLAVNSRITSKLMIALRQLGVGASGGIEALALFHQLVYDEWSEGGVAAPLARIKVDEKNCFGMIEWKSVRDAARQMIPRHAAVASWKHSAASYVEQDSVAPTLKDRGAEQGDVDGPMECSIALATVARQARVKVADLQRRSLLPWATSDTAGTTAACDDYDCRKRRGEAFDAGSDASAELRLDPRDEMQVMGGLVDFWYLDDGDIFCHSQLVARYLQAFDEANARIGAVRNPKKTEVMYYTTPEILDQESAAWQTGLGKEKATILFASEGTLTLGVATGPRDVIIEQLDRKTRVVKAMHERVQLCQNPQTEFVLARDSLGVGRVNHILRVHGH